MQELIVCKPNPKLRSPVPVVKNPKCSTWAEITDPAYIVMFDLANKGTIKFVSNIPGFDTRDVWVQDVDKIEVRTP